MKINLHRMFVLLFCLGCTAAFSQKQDKKLAKANAKYEEFSFVKAGKLYERLVEKGYQSKEIYARLGDSYFFNSDYSNALKWYSKMMEDGNLSSPEYYYRYSVCLMANENHEQAFEVMNVYYKKIGKEEEAKKWNPSYLKTIKEQSDRYDELAESGINSPFSDYGAAFVPNADAVKYSLEAAKLEKAEKARIIKENLETRKKADKGNAAQKEKIVDNSKNKIIESTGDEVIMNKPPRYKEVIYSTAKDSGFLFKRKHSWSEKPFYKFYSAEITEDGKLQNEKKLSGEINSKYHQSTPVFTKDGLTMYFTRLVSYDDVKNKTKDKKAIAQLKIFQAQKINNKWSNIQELSYPVNVEGTSSAHPALSPDEDQLYFVSNRKKKTYDTDIYVVDRKKGGGFARQAEPLSEGINTYGRETFPFVDNTGILYFSSDGHPGLGGLDVFAAVKDDNGSYVVVNLGEPINSASDDFAYVIDGESKRGFFSSNRKEGTGDDDLYKFLELKPVVFPFNLNPVYSGIVKDSIAGEPLRDVEITVFNDLNEKVKTILTDESGKYSVDLPALKDYKFVFKKKGYSKEEIAVKGLKISEKKEIPVSLFNELAVIVDNKVVTLKEGDNLTEKLKLNPIYFDYGGYTIRKSSKLELDKVIQLLKTRQSISIEVRSHTDSRGKDDYNMKLSKNRAKTTIDYIIQEGEISKDRVWGDGYGESQLINNCGNGAKCSEAEHELNRRSDFIMVIKEQIE
jgi:outer membrane protein OmpA-like peptidoglycan-associated protein